MDKAFLFSVSLYTVAFLGFCYFTGRKSQKSLEGFFLANRTFGGLLSALSYAAALYSAFMMVGLVGLAYSTGVGTLIFDLISLAAMLFVLGFFGPKIWRVARAHNLVSPYDLLSHKYSNSVAIVAGVLSLVALIPYTAVQIIGAAVILEPFGLSYNTAVTVLTVLVVLSSLLGGNRGVALSDALQGLFMLAVAFSVFFWSSSRFEFEYAWQTFPNEAWSLASLINFVFPWCLFALAYPPILQRMFMLEDCDKSLRKMLIIYGIFGICFTFLSTSIGFQAAAGTANGSFVAVEEGDKVTGQLMTLMPSWLSLTLALSIIIASITTANSVLLTLSSIVSINLLKQKRVKGVRYTMLVAGILIGLFTLIKGGYIFDLSVASTRYLMIVVPALVGSLTNWRIPASAALSSIILGVLATIVADSTEILSNYSSLIALGSSILPLLIGSLFHVRKLQVSCKTEL